MDDIVQCRLQNQTPLQVDLKSVVAKTSRLRCLTNLCLHHLRHLEFSASGRQGEGVFRRQAFSKGLHEFCVLFMSSIRWGIKGIGR